MTKKKEVPNFYVANCNFTANSAANEFTMNSVVAIAKALEAQAKAAEALSNALKGGGANIGTGLHIGDI